MWRGSQAISSTPSRTEAHGSTSASAKRHIRGWKEKRMQRETEAASAEHGRPPIEITVDGRPITLNDPETTRVSTRAARRASAATR